ncbi:MAG: hypothetical protein H6Q76_1957, partial [Firmicutes bacterium]|nr:hypothetical protein [Bacillota bacterium]
DVFKTVQAFNLTMTGIDVQTDLPLQLEQLLAIELGTPSGKHLLSAKAIWNRENQYGCQFVDMTPTVSRLLSHWLFPPFEP